MTDTWVRTLATFIAGEAKAGMGAEMSADGGVDRGGEGMGGEGRAGPWCGGHSDGVGGDRMEGRGLEIDNK